MYFFYVFIMQNKIPVHIYVCIFGFIKRNKRNYTEI